MSLFKPFSDAVLAMHKFGAHTIVIEDDDWKEVVALLDGAYKFPGEVRTEILTVHGVEIVSKSTMQRRYDYGAKMAEKERGGGNEVPGS